MEELQLTQEQQESNAKTGLLTFWLRMVGWLATGLGAPITTFSIKFGLFNSYGYETMTDELGNVTGTKIAINGWGIVSIILVIFTISSILKEVIEAYSNEYTLAKQCLVGIKNKILPIAILLALCYCLKSCLDQAIFCLTVIGIAQIAAIPLNPLPQWKWNKLHKEDYSDLLTGLTTFIRKQNKKGGK